MNKKLIYIADDEINICTIISSFLLKEGFEVKTFHDGSALLAAFNLRKADLLVLDIMMPRLDGYTLCATIRKTSSVPIIIVSARDTEADKIKGLTLGGDDYLTKPFSPMELVTRVHCIFRRIEFNQEKHLPQQPIHIHDLYINPDSKIVECCGHIISLTVMEFTVLYYLSLHKNRAISRSELLDKVWGFEGEVETRATDDMIKRLRRKLTDAGSNLKIETIWGFGFAIKNNTDAKE
ncbi:MAG: DNA-binding response regulator [Firmicutes bacterium HGW-Firmicutes-7]|nr:MAG: DNA-binding response regulator [Firmicutes bacterium HGW-Firmicutes-7]